jgi:hypothetical protein
MNVLSPSCVHVMYVTKCTVQNGRQQTQRSSHLCTVLYYCLFAYFASFFCVKHSLSSDTDERDSLNSQKFMLIRRHGMTLFNASYYILIYNVSTFMSSSLHLWYNFEEFTHTLTVMWILYLYRGTSSNSSHFKASCCYGNSTFPSTQYRSYGNKCKEFQKHFLYCDTWWAKKIIFLRKRWILLWNYYV